VLSQRHCKVKPKESRLKKRKPRIATGSSEKRIRLISIREQMRVASNYVTGSGLGPFLVRAVAGSGAVQFAGMVLTFLVGVQLARGLGIEGYGQYGIAMAVITLAGIPAHFGLPGLVVREVAAASARKDFPSLFGVIGWADRTSISIALPIALMTALGAYLFIGGHSSPVTRSIALGALTIPLVALTYIRGATLRGLDYAVLGQVPLNLLRPALFSALLFVLFAFWPGAGAADAMTLNVITAASAVVLAHLWLRPRLPRPRPTELVQHRRQWLSSCIPIGMNGAFSVIQGQVGILAIGLFSSDSDVALFRIAVSTVTVIAAPLTVVAVVVTPLLAKLSTQGDTRRLQHLCTRSAQAMAAGTIVLALPFVLWGSELISSVFGPDYAPALPALLVMSAAQVVNAAFGPSAMLLTMTRHERRVTRALFFGLIANLALLLLFVPAWGIVGAAAAMAGSVLVWNLLAWIDVRRLLGIQTSLIRT
jgi:O-antigen/teichoic acid export membrane protein